MNDNRNCSEHISSVLQAYLEELDYRIQHKGEPLGLSTGISALDEILYLLCFNLFEGRSWAISDLQKSIYLGIFFKLFLQKNYI